MAIIKEMVGLKVIDGFKGVIDFYFYMGLACVRTWPKKPKSPRSPAVKEQIVIFKQASLILDQLSPTIIDAYKAMVGSTSLTWKDMFYRGYLAGTLKYFYAVDEIQE